MACLARPPSHSLPDQIKSMGTLCAFLEARSLMADVSLCWRRSGRHPQAQLSFEIITAPGLWLLLCLEQVDVAIMKLEGWTFDSTKVCQPILTGITTCWFDYVSYFKHFTFGGHSRAERQVLSNKGCPLVTGWLSRSLGCDYRIGRERCRDLPIRTDLSGFVIKTVWVTGEVFWLYKCCHKLQTSSLVWIK